MLTKSCNVEGEAAQVPDLPSVVGFNAAGGVSLLFSYESFLAKICFFTLSFTISSVAIRSFFDFVYYYLFTKKSELVILREIMILLCL